MEPPVAKCVNDILEYLKSYRFQFGKGLRVDDFIFRGIANEAHLLLPKALRVTVGGKDKYPVHELEMLARFLKEATTLLPFSFYDIDLRLMQYAQHYGVPTRLLDFTANPLVALYFASTKEFEKDGSFWIVKANTFHNWTFADNDSKFANSGWTMDSIMQNIIDGLSYQDNDAGGKKVKERPLIYVPHYIDNRMSSQVSRMMIWGENRISLEKMAEGENWMDLHSLGAKIVRKDDKRFLSKITIPKEVKLSILEELDLLGINEKTVFQG